MGNAVIELKTGETAVVGYGLLLSRATIDRTLGHPYEGPFMRCDLEGWRRSWDVSMPNATVYYEVDGDRVYPEKLLHLNVRPDAETTMNGVVFVLREDELAAMNRREWIYEGLIVTPEVRGVRVAGGDALVYVGKPEHHTPVIADPRVAALRASYLRMLDDALGAFDLETRDAYSRSTDPLPHHLVIDDRVDPGRR